MQKPTRAGLFLHRHGSKPISDYVSLLTRCPIHWKLAVQVWIQEDIITHFDKAVSNSFPTILDSSCFPYVFQTCKLYSGVELEFPWAHELILKILNPKLLSSLMSGCHVWNKTSRQHTKIEEFAIPIFSSIKNTDIGFTYCQLTQIVTLKNEQITVNFGCFDMHHGEVDWT